MLTECLRPLFPPFPLEYTIIHSGLSSFARQPGHFIKHHQVTAALSAKNTAHHRREIRRLPAVGPRMVNPFLQRAIASFWSGNDTSDLSAQRLTAQAVLAQLAAQPRYRHPRIGFHVSINIHMLGGGEDIHAVLAHGAESGGHHVRFCLWFIIGSVHLVSC